MSNCAVAFESRVKDAGAVVDLKIFSIKNKNRKEDLVYEYYYHKERNYSEYLQLFTDGSKDPQTEGTGAAVVVSSLQTEISERTSDYLSL